MSVLNSADVSKVVRLLPKEVRKTLLKGECVLAGGFIRDAIAGNEINDIDLFPIYQSPSLSEISPRENARSSATLESCPSDQAWAVSTYGRLVRMYVTGSLPAGCRWVDDSRDARGPNGTIMRIPLNRLQPGWEWTAGSPIHPGAGIPEAPPIRRMATRPSTYRLPARDRNWAVTESGVPVELFITASIGNAQWCGNSRDARNQHGVVMRIPATDYLPSGWQWVDSTVYPGAGYPVTGPQSWSESFRSPHASSTNSTTTATAPWGSELAERIANEVAFPYDAEPSQHAFNVKGLKYPVQVIRIGRPENAQQVLDSFDFTMSRAAIWFKNEQYRTSAASDGGWKSLCHDSFYEDLSAKRLVYCSPADELLGSSLLRLLKFYGRGFTAPNETISQIVARVAKAPNETVEAVAQNVNQALRNVYGTAGGGNFSIEPELETPANTPVAPSADPIWSPPIERRTPPSRAGSFVWADPVIAPMPTGWMNNATPVAANVATAEAVINASERSSIVADMAAAVQAVEAISQATEQ